MYVLKLIHMYVHANLKGYKSNNLKTRVKLITCTERKIIE